MARPTLITVKGQFLKLDGTPETGIVEFQSHGYRLYSSKSIAIVPSRILATLDIEGNLEIQVPATNDPAWAPSGWKYTLVLRLSSDYSIYEIDVPYDVVDGEVSLAELLPVSGNVPVFPANYAPLVHNHAAADIVSGIIASARLPIGTTAGTIAAGDHTHTGSGSGGPVAITDITGLVDALNSKAATNHTHTIADVANLQISLNGKANSVHTHAITDTSGLQSVLDAKAAVSHNHSSSDILGLADTLSEFITSEDLSSVALSGSYNDLTDKPIIGNSPVASVAGRTGDVVLTKSDVGLANVDNTSDLNKPVSTATQAALNTKADNGHVHNQNDVTGLTAALSAKIDAEDLATVATTGSYNDLADKPIVPVTSVAGQTGDVTLAKSDVGLSNVDNTSDVNKPVSTAQQTALDLKANLASPTFTGTVSGITKSMVGLGNVDNTSDATKNSATATLSNKTLASPAFTGTPTGLTKSHVGLANVDNTSDANKPISTATQTALNSKADTTALTAVSNRVTAVEDMTPVIMVWNGSAYVESSVARIYVGPNDPGTVPDGSIWIDTDA